MLNKILDIIYPPVCGVCGRIDKNSLCKKCAILFKNQAVFGIEKYNKDSNMYFDEHLYIFMYSGIVRKILLDYKFKDKSFLYKTFTNFLIKNEKFVENIKRYDIIIPVPLSSKREKQRGYNQSKLIAKQICVLTGLELNSNSLKKVLNTVAQSSLNKEDRQTNIEGAYILGNLNQIKQKKVLLVDDIYTTGSTANECCRLINNGGAEKIGVLTIAKD